MASAAATSAVQKMLGKKKLSVDDVIEIRSVALTDPDESKALTEICHGNWESGAKPEQLATAFWARGQTEEAIQAAEKISNTSLKDWILGASYLELGRYAEAAERLCNVAKNSSHPKVLLAYADALAACGKADELRELAKSRVDGQVALAHYVEGLVQVLEGDYEKALEEFNEAVRIDENLHEAYFRLGYLVGLYGYEEDAIPYYEKCLASAPGFVNALINLGILYEDLGLLDKAEECYGGVLAVCPMHPRARLYFKDVRASQREVIEEERDREFVKEENVLDMPWTEFELSVRSRTCLEKMGIRTLGDLTRVTEKQLLSYKNFGETSLNEIKRMLAQKGLRLGQALEEDISFRGAGRRPTHVEKLLEDLTESTEGRSSIHEVLTRSSRRSAPIEPIPMDEESEFEMIEEEEGALEEPDVDELPDEEQLLDLEDEEHDYDEVDEDYEE